MMDPVEVCQSLRSAAILIADQTNRYRMYPFVTSIITLTVVVSSLSSPTLRRSMCCFYFYLTIPLNGSLAI